jgi:hypothetical protein
MRRFDIDWSPQWKYENIVQLDVATLVIGVAYPASVLSILISAYLKPKRLSDFKLA